MSVRVAPQKTLAAAMDPEVLRAELEELRSAHARNSTDLPMGAAPRSLGVVSEASREFDRLTPAEQQAASLGVHPDSFKPLKSLNDAHFEVLRQANALSAPLEAQILAYRSVAEGSA